MPVGKQVTIISDVDAILKDPYYRLQFYNTTVTKEWQFPTGKVPLTIINYTASVIKSQVSVLSLKYIRERYEKYVGFNLTMILGPVNRQGIDEEEWNLINSTSSEIFNKRLAQDLMNYIINDKFMLELSYMNAESRYIFKRVWQLKYPKFSPWDSLNGVIEAYKRDILKSNILSLSSILDLTLLWLGSSLIYPSYLQAYLTSLLRAASTNSQVSSPAFLYSLTLSTGDYRYILVAILASIIAIMLSLGIGLKDVKIETKNLLEKSKWWTEKIWEIIFIVIFAFVNPAGAAVKVGTAITKFIIRDALREVLKRIFSGALGYLVDLLFVETWIASIEYNDLFYSSYSHQFLLNLVKITELDLSLLNYEIEMWDHLRD
jgi:hypothetical protein